MENIFSQEWAERFAHRWNDTNDMVDPLAAAHFDSIIAFGFINEINPVVTLEVRNGKIEQAGPFNATSSPVANWDLRAAPEH